VPAAQAAAAATHDPFEQPRALLHTAEVLAEVRMHHVLVQRHRVLHQCWYAMISIHRSERRQFVACLLGGWVRHRLFKDLIVLDFVALNTAPRPMHNKPPREKHHQIEPYEQIRLDPASSQEYEAPN